ncbi:hypothetical protein EV356DRAFT_506793 [Viridothelium virens]|uniref:DUF7730 domain-containing protein n=1 Tax=Viridothelium virens TaxID=1048519 RepID=A0A6A6H112_VIRVR|nr:hypothetical protein EV356DRAFT_506793 [Viridothelium virens]
MEWNSFGHGLLKYPLIALIECFCCLFPEAERQRRRRNEANSQYRYWAPPPIRSPHMRGIALTTPLHASSNLVYFEQEESLLFTRLPAELRREIFCQALGGLYISLKMTRGDSAHFNYSIWPAEDRLKQWDHPLFQNKMGYDAFTCRKQFLSLLLTCRQIYSEAIDVLYSQNVFDMPWATVLVHFPQILPTPRLNAIRHLYVDCHLPSVPGRGQTDKSWKEIWCSLAAMHGLQELYFRIMLDWVYKQDWLELEPKVLEPVKTVRDPREFEVLLPFAEAAQRMDEADLSEYSCRFRRPNEGLCPPPNFDRSWVGILFSPSPRPY